MFKQVIAALAILVVGTMPALAKRVALVIGNGAYEHTVALPNPANDAEAMATKLRGLGFDVVSGQDQTYSDMRKTVMTFAKKAYAADIALLFYAGHGMQVAGQNLLVPVDATLEDETSLDFETISVDFILRQMSKDVKVQMVFLDACRDNPLSRSLAQRMGPSRSGSLGRGLAEIKVQETGGEGSVIAFATSPGDVALDGEGTNSPFTTALIKHIDTPNASIQTVMTRVTGEVYDATEKRQRPWVNASLIGEVFLNKQATEQTAQVASLGSAATTSSPQTTVPAVSAETTINWEREKLVWNTVKEADTIADYQGYLDAYPEGTFVNFAKNAIKRLESETQVASRNASGTNGVATQDPTAAVAASATPALPDPQKAVPGTPQTEASLGWNRNSRREVQTRLNLAGHDVGRPDGAFGPKTRAGVMAWQTRNDIIPTGYFTPAQYALLVSQTAPQFAAFMEEVKRKQAVAAQTRSSVKKNPPPREARQQREGGGINPAGAAFVGGVVGGIIGGAIGR